MSYMDVRLSLSERASAALLVTTDFPSAMDWRSLTAALMSPCALSAMVSTATGSILKPSPSAIFLSVLDMDTEVGFLKVICNVFVFMEELFLLRA